MHDIENLNANTNRNNIIINIEKKRGRIVERIQESLINFK